MNLKSRLLRLVLITLAVLAFVGYFAFSTFLFSPVEGAFRFDLSALVPRDVDFYASRADLQRVFDPFPQPAVLPELEDNPAWIAFQGSSDYQQLYRDLNLDESLAQLDQTLESLPISVEPLKVFGGKDVAVAGYFRGADLAQADWLVYGRVNWMGKLAVAALSYPGLLGLEQQGLAVDVGSNWVSLGGGQLTRPLYISRLKDIVIVGTNSGLVERAGELEATSSADSLFLSARYQDYVETSLRSPRKDEVELFVDLRKLLENAGHSGPWPDPASHFFTQAFLGRLFQVPACKELIGLVDMDEGLTADFHGEFSSELIDTRQNRIYRERGFESVELLRDAAGMAPADTVFFAYVHAPIGDVLRALYESMEPAARSNLDDFFAGIPEYRTTEGVISALENSLRDRVAFIVRANDYPPDPEGPPHDDTTVFALTLVTWVSPSSDGRASLERLRDKIGLNGQRLGLQGRNGGAGYIEYMSDGFETREFWQPLVPGTGVVTTINTSEYMLISNTLSMPSQVIKTGTVGGRSYPSLADRPDFSALVNSSLQSANAVVWLDPQPARKTILQQLEDWAAINALDGIDWRQLRAQQEASSITEMFPGKSKRQLTADELQQFEAVVTRELSEQRERLREERIPAVRAERKRLADYVNGLESLLLMLRLDPKEFDLTLRAVVPYAGPQPVAGG